MTKESFVIEATVEGVGDEILKVDSHSRRKAGKKFECVLSRVQSGSIQHIISRCNGLRRLSISPPITAGTLVISTMAMEPCRVTCARMSAGDMKEM